RMRGGEHGHRDIGADHAPSPPNPGERHGRHFASARRDVEHSVSDGDLGSRQYLRHEQTRPAPKGALVCREADGLAACRMKSGAEVHAHRRPDVFTSTTSLAQPTTYMETCSREVHHPDTACRSLP